MNRCLKRILSAQLNGLALGLLALSAPAAQPAAVPANLPLFFEASQGQAANPAQFIARGHDYQFLISPTETQIVLRKTTGTATSVRMQFAGASAQAQISGDTELPGKINYLTGNDPAKWHTGVATFAKVRVGELYPGINLVYYGNQRQLEYDFTVTPGANPNAVRIHFDGVDKVAISKQGELILTLGDAEIRQPKPVIYQMASGARKEVEGGYRLVDARTVAFAIGQYDQRLPLVIDPILSYSTYFGGNYGDTAWAVAVDTNGFVYVAGQTFSTRFTNNAPLATPGAYQTNFHGGTLYGDAFIAKFDNLGTNLIYFTYLGGSADDLASGIAVDGQGNAFVTGITDSPDFPTTNAIPGHAQIGGSYSPSFGSYPSDAFVAELNSGGSNLIFSTYLGGSGMDGSDGIALDLSGNIYVTGYTFSTNFPVTNAIAYRLAGRTNMFLDHLACTNTVYYNANAFIAKIGPGGTNLVYSSYFGGNNLDAGESIAVDSSNFVYVTGFTASTNFPTKNAITNSLNGYLLNGSTNQTSSYDAFVAKFDSTGTNLLYSTFLGGTNNDVAYSIAIDNQGAAYVTGWTVSSNFPNTVTLPNLYNGLANNFYYGYSVTTNAFLTKITNGVQAAIAYSAVFGGTNLNTDIGYGVALDPAGDAFVIGTTTSINFPAFNVPSLMRATNSGGNDAFVIAFNANATALLYSTYLGGASDDFGYGIAVDPLGNAYIIGQTFSANFPTLNARQTTLNGTSDAFLAKIVLPVAPPEIDTNREPISQTNQVGSSVTFSVYLTTNGTPPFFFQWQIVGTNLIGTNLVDGGNISGATGNILTISPAQVTNSGSYWLIVTNYGGSVTSSLAMLSITNVPPTITVQPTNQAVVVGANVTNVVVAIGTPPLSYQWRVNGTNLVNGGAISGATTNVLIISNAQTNNSATNYSVIVTNFGGSVTSSVVTLIVASSPVILTQPANQTVVVGANVTNVVVAIGTPPLSYQWRVNGTNLVNGGAISGATTNKLIISNAQTTNRGNYTVVVTNLAGSVTSSNALLTVISSPIITVQPTNQTIGVGHTVTLTVTAVGIEPLGYQWWLDETNKLVDGGNISGATTNMLTISNAQTNNSGSYSVIVTNSVGSMTSSNAVLTVVRLMVVAWGDNGDGQTNVPVDATNVMAIAGGGYHSLALQANGTVVPWGADDSGQTDVPADLTNVVAIAAGYLHSLALQANGTVAGWGAGTNNTGSFPEYGQAMVPSDLTNVVAIAGAFFHNLALQANGTVVAWGDNTYGQTNVPPDLTNVVAVAGSGYDSLALQANGTVVVWGDNTYGQTNMPPGLTNVMAIAGGGFHCLALRANGTVVAWGDNIYGQTNVPADLTNVVAIAGGGFHSLALRANGTVVAWGADDYGQTNVPADLTNVVAVAGGYLHSMALENDGSPFIVRQPASQTTLTNTTVTFTVIALGAPALSYQWQKNGSNLFDGGNVSGSTSATLTLTDVQAADAAGYTVVITNAIGSVTSSNAVLTVTNIPLGFIPLSFGNIHAAAGDSFILSGTGGVNNGVYYVLVSSNLLTPLTNWMHIATNHFDSTGHFIFTNTTQTNTPQEFYLLQMP